MKDERNISTNLIRYRLERNITQRDLAAKTNMNQSQISGFESGRNNPTTKLLIRLSVGMGVTLNWLVL